MSLLTPEEAQAAGIGLELSTEALQDAIDEEEAWLARRIGPLEGERVERFVLTYLMPHPSEVRLRRPTDEVEVTMDGTDVTTLVEVRGDGWVVAYLPTGARFTGVLEVTSTPNDELEVRKALKELLGMSLSPAGGFQSEIMGSYAYTRAGGSTTRLRKSIVRSLLAPATAGSLRILSSVRHGTLGAIGR